MYTYSSSYTCTYDPVGSMATPTCKPRGVLYFESHIRDGLMAILWVDLSNITKHRSSCSGGL